MSQRCVLWLSNSVLFGKQQQPSSYVQKMSSFDENLDRGTRQACLVLSEKDCKDLQRICLRHLISNWDVLRPIGGIAVDELHTAIHW